MGLCNRLHYHVLPLYHSSSMTPMASAGMSVVETLTSVRSGESISRDAAFKLIGCSDDDLPSLLAAARAAKERFKPTVITYSRKVFLPLTNLCRDYCGYCTFRRDPGDPGAHTMTPGRSSGGSSRGRKTGLHRSALQPGRQAGTAVPGDARDAAPSRVQVDAALS